MPHLFPATSLDRLWIRPVLCKATNRHLSLSVCTTEHALLVDEQIVCHFPFNTSGTDIKAEFPDATISWGPLVLV